MFQKRNYFNKNTLFYRNFCKKKRISLNIDFPVCCGLGVTETRRCTVFTLLDVYFREEGAPAILIQYVYILPQIFKEYKKKLFYHL